MKQRTLKNHLEIAGVPIMQNENLTDIFTMMKLQPSCNLGKFYQKKADFYEKQKLL
jgi:hypothetical protein